MRIGSYTSEGFILNIRDYFESDKIVIIYTKDFGRLSLVAKGVKKNSSRKRGHLDTFNLVRFKAVKGKTTDILTEVETVESFSKTKTSLKKISLGYYFSEVLQKITHEGEPDIELYQLSDKFFRRLSETNSLKKLREEFVRELLITNGFWSDNKKIFDYDLLLEEVIERKVNSFRVGKIISS